MLCIKYGRWNFAWEVESPKERAESPEMRGVEDVVESGVIVQR